MEIDPDLHSTSSTWLDGKTPTLPLRFPRHQASSSLEMRVMMSPTYHRNFFFGSAEREKVSIDEPTIGKIKPIFATAKDLPREKKTQPT